MKDTLYQVYLHKLLEPVWEECWQPREVPVDQLDRRYKMRGAMRNGGGPAGSRQVGGGSMHSDDTLAYTKCSDYWKDIVVPQIHEGMRDYRRTAFGRKFIPLPNSLKVYVYSDERDSLIKVGWKCFGNVVKIKHGHPKM